MVIRVQLFKGVRPKASDHLLEPSEGVIARNINVTHGDARAFRLPSLVETLPSTGYKTLFQYYQGANSYWVKSTNDVNFVRNPIVGDAFERMYFTGESEPRMFANDKISIPFNPSTDYEKMGVKIPASAPAFVSGHTGGSAYRAYVYTYVSRYGEEGPPSPVLSTSTYLSGNVVLGGFTDPGSTWGKLRVASGSGGVNRPKIRLYRTTSATGGTAAFQFVKEVNVDGINWATFQITDDVVTTSEVIPSVNWEPPPDDLKGIVDSGICLAGFSGNDLWFTEPNIPSAWNPDYTISFAEKIVGLGVLGTSVVVLTDESPYIVYGSHPSTLTKQRMDGVYPCLSKRSISSTEYGVIYTSQLGFIVVTAKGVTPLTIDHMTAEDMNDYYPETMLGVFYDQKYYGFYYDPDSLNKGCLMYDLRSGNLSDLTYHALAAFVSRDDARMYVICKDDGSSTLELLKQWQGSQYDYMEYTWKSKKFIMSETMNFSTARVMVDLNYYTQAIQTMEDNNYFILQNQILFPEPLQGEINGSELGDFAVNGDILYTLFDLNLTNTISFSVYVDNQLRFTKSVSNDSIFRLPGGYRGKRIQFEIRGFIPVKEVVLATSVREVMESG